MIITIYWKYLFDRNDEIEFAVLPQKFDRSPKWWSDRIGDRLWYGFDWELIRAEKNRPQWRSDRIGDLTERWFYSNLNGSGTVVILGKQIAFSVHIISLSQFIFCVIRPSESRRRNFSLFIILSENYQRKINFLLMAALIYIGPIRPTYFTTHLSTLEMH